MKIISKIFCGIGLLILFASCGAVRTPYVKDDIDPIQKISIDSTNILHTLYLVGDAGEFDYNSRNNMVLDAVSKTLKHENENSSLVFLGDNIYPSGLPKITSKERSIMEAKINNQLQLTANFEGQTFFIPGNHDWNRSFPGGLDAIKRQGNYIKANATNQNVNMLPKNGCGDPEIKKISDNLVFVFIDSQWWLQDWDKEPGINIGCEIKTRYEFVDKMKDIFIKHKDDQIVVFMHHPIKSNGLHGGKFSFKHHIFPLHDKGNWLPLPILGSIYPIYVQSTGSFQDIINLKYKSLASSLQDAAIRANGNVIFASGHEHGLQLFENEKIQYIVSGSGSKVSYLQKGGEPTFLFQERGYCKLIFLKDKSVYAEYYAKSSSDFELVFSKNLVPIISDIPEIIKELNPIIVKDTLVLANESNTGNYLQNAILGSNYREEWSTKIKVPIVDLSDVKGGLNPIKLSGINATLLTMESKSGHEYILKSIRKNGSNQAPLEFRKLDTHYFLKDQNSGNFPYGPMSIPTLSKSANIYYTNPELYYIKKQKNLKEYINYIPEGLYYLEERPVGNWSDAPNFGYSKNIVSHTNLLVNLQEKSNHIIDQPWTLRTRLFDMWIHDWDRYDEQYKWAQFDEKNQTIYRPIPQDRDLAFYKQGGIIPTIISHTLMRNLKSFGPKINDIVGLNLKARHFDRSYLNELDKEQWINEVVHIQSNVNDSIINLALNQVPDGVSNQTKATVIKNLIKRKDNLLESSLKMYHILAKEIEIAGTDLDDIFKVNYLGRDSILIEVFTKVKSKPDFKRYQRLFNSTETEVIRLYGLKGNDEFHFVGNKHRAIEISIIGGLDDDKVFNQSLSTNIKVYDKPDGIVTYGNKIKDRTSDDIYVNEYNRYQFKYDTSLPMFVLGSSVDEGLWIGGGYSWTKFGWRKKPYASKQNVQVSFAPTARGSLHLQYSGDFIETLNKLDFSPYLSLDLPRYQSYFGIGNNTQKPSDDIYYNLVKLNSVSVKPYLQYRIKKNNAIKFGIGYEYHKILKQENRIVTDETYGLSQSELNPKNYLTFDISNLISVLDNKLNPNNGFTFNANVSYFIDPFENEKFFSANAESNAYLRVLGRPNTILANSIGYKIVLGDAQFYQKASLGNFSHLRGYRINRFINKSSFYQNIDLRSRFVQSKNNILPFDLGVLLGFDYGTTFTKIDGDNEWYSSLTFGVWAEILGMTILNPYYSITEEENTFTFQMKFSF